jgi:hypothetical protein
MFISYYNNFNNNKYSAGRCYLTYGNKLYILFNFQVLTKVGGRRWHTATEYAGLVNWYKWQCINLVFTFQSCRLGLYGIQYWYFKIRNLILNLSYNDWMWWTDVQPAVDIFVNIMIKQYYLHVIKVNISVSVIWICKIFVLVTSVLKGFPKVHFEESEWFGTIFIIRPIVVTVLSKTQVRGLSIAGIKNSNPTEGIHVLFCVCCVLCS